MAEDTRRIIDHIIEQADRYDGLNIEIEQKVIDSIAGMHEDMTIRIIQTVEIHGDITTMLRYQTLINRIQVIVENFYNDAYRLFVSSIGEHTDKGYNDMADLIDLGMELEDKARKEQVTEFIGKKTMPDSTALEFMKNHAFEQLKNVSNDIINQLKTQLGSMVVQGRGDKANVRNAVEKILGSSRSRADMIAQTELSMAYNSGAIARFDEFNQTSKQTMRKYWYGFKYSETTCSYCRPHIGEIYDVKDATQTLPAHPRCRCVWLPFMSGWDKPISTMFTRSKNMIERVYSPEQIYGKLNTRLGIDYASYLPQDAALRYLKGDRSGSFYATLGEARDKAIKDTSANFDIAKEKSGAKMEQEFNMQMSFWKKYTSRAIVDKDIKDMKNSYEAIKGVMILPWTGRQLSEWAKILKVLEDNIR